MPEQRRNGFASQPCIAQRISRTPSSLSKTALHMDGWLTPKEKGPAAIVVGLTGRLVFM